MCQHQSLVGDNYGMTCADCGQVIEGFGNGGWFGSNLTGHETCQHSQMFREGREEYCPYCEAYQSVKGE